MFLFKLVSDGCDTQLLRVCVSVSVLVTQSCPTLWDLMDCRPPGSSVRGILQARTLEWVAILSSRGSSQPRDGTQSFCLADIFFTISATKEVTEPGFKSRPLNFERLVFLIYLDAFRN